MTGPHRSTVLYDTVQAVQNLRLALCHILAFNPTKGRQIQHLGELNMSVHLTNTVSILLKSLQMKSKHWWGTGDQHLLQGISVDILLGSSSFVFVWLPFIAGDTKQAVVLREGFHFCELKKARLH